MSYFPLYVPEWGLGAFIHTLAYHRLRSNIAGTPLAVSAAPKKDFSVLVAVPQGIFYYENIQTGETRWVPPRLMQRLFPKLRW